MERRSRFSETDASAATSEYRTPEEYSELIKTLRAFTGIVLYGFLDDRAMLRERIIRNFIARGQTCLESIEALWYLQHYQDCYSLYRSLLDRLLYLDVLDRDDSFGQFDDWSFMEQFRIANYARCHLEFKGRPGVHVFSDAEKERYKALSAGRAPRWNRPNAECVAKAMGLDFLYHLGYAHASQHVHPMANDGQEDFERIALLRKDPMFDQRSVLNNAVLVHLLLTQKGLNASGAHWRTLIYTFIEDCVDFLKTGAQRYQVTFMKIGMQGPHFSWAKWDD